MDGLTNLPSPQDTETALVVCYYLDATPKFFLVPFSGEVTKIDIRIHMNWHLLLADLLGRLSKS